MQAIHAAAWRGDLAEVNQLLEEDGGLLNAQGLADWTPLMYAAEEGHDAVVARLLALGADAGLQEGHGWSAAHRACMSKRPSTLALLVDAGVPLSVRDNYGYTPLMIAMQRNATGCVELLLARGGATLEIDASNVDGYTVLHLAALLNKPESLQLLLQAGANPTIPNTYGSTPLDTARININAECTAILEAAIAPSLRARSLLKARALLDAEHAVEKARGGVRTRAAQQRAAVGAAPAYLKGRVEKGQQLPRVEVEGEAAEEAVACLKYALGLAYGAGVHEEGQGEPPVGMLRDVFVELCEMLVPKWDRKNV